MVNLKKVGLAIRKKRGQRGLRELAVEIGHGISPATLSRLEHSGICSRDADLAIIVAWLGMTVEEIESIELPPAPTPESEAERTAPICLHCKTPLENVGPTSWKETETVMRMKYYEDDAELVPVDETFTVHAMAGWCPKCKRRLTQDSYSGLWF